MQKQKELRKTLLLFFHFVMINKYKILTKYMKEFTKSNTCQSSSFVAILRGTSPNSCLAIAEEIYQQGLELIEFPINLDKKAAFQCVEKLAKQFPDKKIGIGTALTPEDVVAGKNAGASFIVSPNFNPAVVKKTKELGLFSMPGIFTPSEAFCALAAGADGLKVFPISAFVPSAMQSLIGVLPPKTTLMPTGSISPQEAISYLRAGVSKIGLGSVIYKANDSSQAVSQKLQNFLKIALSENLKTK